MQNKPNFQDTQMNVNPYDTMEYENISDWTLGQNKPNSNPIKPNLRKCEIDTKCVFTKDYRKKDDFLVRINKPNLVRRRRIPKMNANLYVIEDYENEPPSGPKKQTQFKPNLRKAKIACQKIRPHPSRGCAKNCLQKRPFWLYSSGLSGYGGLRPDQSNTCCKERMQRWRKKIQICRK